MKGKVLLVPVLACMAVWGLVSALTLLSRSVPQFGLFQRLEWMTYDWRVSQAAARASSQPTQLGFVNIREESIRALLRGELDYKVGLYWPRHVYGRLVEELSQQGALAVGFDVLFVDLRPDHPNAVLPDGTEEGSDQFFARALREAGNVALASSRGDLPAALFRTNAWGLADISAKPDSDGVLRRARAYEEVYDWHPLIKEAAYRQHFDLRQGRFENNQLVFPLQKGGAKAFDLQDGKFDQGILYEDLVGQPPPPRVVRWIAPATRYRSWDMGILLGARALGIDLNQAKIEPGRITLRSTNGVERVIPIDHEGRFYIDWSITPYDPRLTREAIESVLNQARERGLGHAAQTNLWANKLVFVGSTASGNDLTDTGPTPLEKETYLTSRFWNVANSLMENRFTREPSVALTIGYSLCGCFLAGWLTWSLRSRSLGVAALGMVLVAGAFVLVARHVFLHDRWWVPIFFPLLSLVLTHGALITYNAVFEKNERRRIKSVFNKMVSPNVVTELLGAGQLRLGGTRRNITVFFADVRGFTELADDLQAQAEEHVRSHQLGDREAEDYLDAQSQQLLGTVNLYLSLIADIVKRNEGTLDKYIGDCVMSFWGAPTPNPKHALAAVRSAIEVQRTIQRLNRERAEKNRLTEAENVRRLSAGQSALPLLRLLDLGSGLNSGSAIAGLMGSQEHILSYTVFGRQVNLASRLETLSARGRIIIGESTYLEIHQDDPALASSCVELAPTPVKGFRAPVRVFEVPWREAGSAPSS